MSDTEILMELQRQVADLTGAVREFIHSQESLNAANTAQHDQLFEKVDWIKTRTIIIMAAVAVGGGGLGGIIARLL